jgi:demethylmenaquinone methyltransferase/2-methoxy-6-polyprenyl-1,4-benzoquinol methylase
MKGVDKKQRVEEMFDAIAPRYDALNHVLSLGIDRGWRRRVVRVVKTGFRVLRGGSGGDSVAPKILDVATGTGDLAIALARAIPGARITGTDLSEGMLALGREKIARRVAGSKITLVSGDAEALEFADGSFDAVTVAFGVRNFGDLPRGLAEMRRVLRSGGRLVVLEFSVPRGALFGWVFGIYFHRLVPWVGRLVSRHGEAYTYLPRSVDDFPSPADFAAMMRRAGFGQVRTRSLTFGVATIYEGVR